MRTKAGTRTRTGATRRYRRSPYRCFVSLLWRLRLGHVSEDPGNAAVVVAASNHVPREEIDNRTHTVNGFPLYPFPSPSSSVSDLYSNVHCNGGNFATSATSPSKKGKDPYYRTCEYRNLCFQQRKRPEHTEPNQDERKWDMVYFPSPYEEQLQQRLLSLQQNQQNQPQHPQHEQQEVTISSTLLENDSGMILQKKMTSTPLSPQLPETAYMLDDSVVTVVFFFSERQQQQQQQQLYSFHFWMHLYNVISEFGMQSKQMLVVMANNDDNENESPNRNKDENNEENDPPNGGGGDTTSEDEDADGVCTESRPEYAEAPLAKEGSSWEEGTVVLPRRPSGGTTTGSSRLPWWWCLERRAAEWRTAVGVTAGRFVHLNGGGPDGPFDLRAADPGRKQALPPPRLVCSRHAVTSRGVPTEGEKEGDDADPSSGRGAGASSPASSPPPVPAATYRVGQGAQLWKFRNFMARNLQRNMEQPERGLTIAATTTTPFQETVCFAGSFPPPSSTDDRGEGSVPRDLFPKQVEMVQDHFVLQQQQQQQQEQEEQDPYHSATTTTSKTTIEYLSTVNDYHISNLAYRASRCTVLVAVLPPPPLDRMNGMTTLILATFLPRGATLVLYRHRRGGGDDDDGSGPSGRERATTPSGRRRRSEERRTVELLNSAGYFDTHWFEYESKDTDASVARLRRILRDRVDRDRTLHHHQQQNSY